MGASARPDSSALRRAQPRAGRDESTWATAAPARAQASVDPPVYANSDSTRGWRPSLTVASRTDLSSQAHVAACSGKTPTWPPAAARHSSVRPPARTGHGSLAAPITHALFAQRRVGFAHADGGR